METETIIMSSRRRMVLKPFSAPGTTLQCKEQNSSNTNEHVMIQPPAALISPKNDKKKILFQDAMLTETIPTVQRNRVLLSCTINKDLLDSDDSDSDVSTINDVPFNKSPPNSNTKLYYTVIMFLCWAAVQYWMIAVVGFGAVFFAVSALIAMYYSTSNAEKKSNVLSAYSVFNPQCTPIQGSVDPKQLERELLFG